MLRLSWLMGLMLLMLSTGRVAAVDLDVGDAVVTVDAEVEFQGTYARDAQAWHASHHHRSS
jgi:hypothetical protein